MSKKIEELYKTIAMGIYAVRPELNWVKGTLKFKSITLMNESACFYTLEKGTTVSVDSGFDVDDTLEVLRNEMATVHENRHAWYSSECEVRANNEYTFRFDYDHLPAFNIIPSPNKWHDEFRKYPRPELKTNIQDWIDGKVQPNEIVQRLKQMQTD